MEAAPSSPWRVRDADPEAEELAGVDHERVLRSWQQLGNAAFQDDCEALEILLGPRVAAPWSKEGADPNDPEQYWNGNDAPLSVASYRGYTEAVQLLLTANADPQWQDADGETALHRAAANGHDAIVKLLVGAAKLDTLGRLRVNDRDRMGDTPLICAARNGEVAALKSLLAAPGIDPTLCSPQWGTAEDIASTNEEWGAVAMLQNPQFTLEEAEDEGEELEYLAGATLTRLQEAKDAAAAHTARDLEMSNGSMGGGAKEQGGSLRRAGSGGGLEVTNEPLAGSLTEDSNVYVDPVPCRNLGEAALQANLVAIKRLIATPMANGRPIDPNDRGHATAYGKLKKAEKKKGGEKQGLEGKEATEADEVKAAGIAEAYEALANEVEDGKNPGQFWSHYLRGNCAPLWLAATQGHTEIVSLLLGAKANAAWADEYEQDTALHCAASWWGKESVAFFLI